MSNGKGEVVAPRDGSTVSSDVIEESENSLLKVPRAIVPKNPATLFQKILLSAYLLTLSIVCIFCINNRIDKVNIASLAETTTPWELPVWAKLRSGPASFQYDTVKMQLINSGLISAEKKLQLRDLLEFQPIASIESTKFTPVTTTANENSSGQVEISNDKSKLRELEVKGGRGEAIVTASGPITTSVISATRIEEIRNSYNSAIDRLAYQAASHQGAIVQHLLLLGLFGGALGAVLRSLVDFVGHACYTRQLDLEVWWPLYFTRPIVGGILGYVLVVLFKARLLTSGDFQPGDDSFWWLGVAVIGGFSTVDVTLRLRVAAKALFGVESNAK